MRYQDFIIQIDFDKESSYRARVVESPAGEGQTSFKLPVEPEELGGFLIRLGQAIRHSSQDYSCDRDLLGLEQWSDDEDSRKFGEKLFTALFSGEIRNLYDHSLGQISQKSDAGLRIQLKLDLRQAELVQFHSLPWELLRHPETGDELGLSAVTSVIRYLDVQRPPAASILLPPLRILVVVSSSKGYEDLNLQEEEQRIRKVLEKHESYELEFAHAEVEAVYERLLRGRFHVLHFMGHGHFQASTGEGVLVFEGPNKTPNVISGQKLAVDLRASGDLRLVVLNACDTARTSSQYGVDPFNGVATALVHGGIPAVVAMQFPISDHAAILFSHKFYKRLAEGYPVDRAVVEGRLAINRENAQSLEWATPVLFLRSRSPAASLVAAPEARRASWKPAFLVVLVLLAIQLIFDPSTDLSNSIYQIRVTVVDPQGKPVEDARVRASVPGALKKLTSGGWELAIPEASRPADKWLHVYATKDSAFLAGHQAVQLGEERVVSVIVRLKKDQSASVEGTVFEAGVNRPIEGAQVWIVGKSEESVTTTVTGRFVIPSRVAQGEEVLIHAQKDGFRPIDQYHLAGGESAIIELSKNRRGLK